MINENDRVICPMLFVALLAMGIAGCRKEDMAEQPRVDPHVPSAFFDDGNSARPLVEGTISRGGTASDAYEYLRTPMSTTAPAAALVRADFPADFPRTGAPLLRQIERGRERYTIFCAVCHGDTGAGDGMIVQRGFTRPPAFYPLAVDAQNNADLYRRERSLLNVPPGYIYDKITNGYGAMYSYAARVPPADRWAIAAYVRVLQKSQYAAVTDLTEHDIAQANEVKRGVKP